MQENRTDREILELIKEQALADAPKPDFENVRRRVAALSDDAGSDDGLGYRDIFPEPEKKPSMIRYAAAAAAIIAAVGLSAAAASRLFAGNTASETAYSADAVYEESAAEWNAEADNDEPYDSAETFSEEAEADLTEEAVDEEADGNAYNAPEAPMETPAETTTAVSAIDSEAADDTAFSGSESAENNAPYIETDLSGEDDAVPTLSEAPDSNSTALSEEDAALYDYYVKDLGVTLGIPYQAFCTGPDVSDSFPPLERFDMTAGQLESNYKNRGICFNAIWYDEDGADVIEIVVASEDVSDRINNLSSLSEYDMEQLRQSYLRYGSDSPDSPRYYDVSVVTIKGQPYIRALGKDYAGKACHSQYMTIVNGRRIKFSLIEHYADTDLPEEGVSPAHTALMDSVAASIRYDRVRSEFVYRLSRLRPTAWVSLLGIIILIIYGIHYLIERRKHPFSEEQQPGEELPSVSDIAESGDVSSGDAESEDVEGGDAGSNDVEGGDAEDAAGGDTGSGDTAEAEENGGADSSDSGEPEDRADKE